MFDGIDHVTLFGPDLEDLLALYQGHLGFVQTSSSVLEGPSGPYHNLWRLPDGPLHVRTLEKPGSTGGNLRLVGAPSLPGPDAPRTMHQPGPFAIDFYVRDLPTLHERLRTAGYRFRSDPVRYTLFGTGFEVEEVLLEAPLGFVHALVGYLPDRHRCVLSTQPAEQVSEVVAAITVIDDIDEGLRTLRDALDGEVYFDQVFHGSTIETLIGIPPGSAFRAVLLRGPSRRNARAELMQRVPRASDGTEPPRAHPHLALSMPATDLDRAVARLPSDTGIAGPFEPDEGPHAGRRVAAAWTRWGGVLELVEGPTRKR